MMPPSVDVQVRSIRLPSASEASRSRTFGRGATTDGAVNSAGGGARP